MTQTVEVIDPQQRDRRIEELLRKHHASRKNRIIIFVLYKKEAARVEAMLGRKGWSAVAVHGDASQQQRTANVEQFKVGPSCSERACASICPSLGGDLRMDALLCLALGLQPEQCAAHGRIAWRVGTSTSQLLLHPCQ